MARITDSILRLLSRANTWAAAQAFNALATFTASITTNTLTCTGEASINGFANVSQRLCKAWVNFNGTGTIAIRDSYNVSSITDGGVGSYTVNFTNPMSNANYCAQLSAGLSTGSPLPGVGGVANTAPTTTALYFETRQSSTGVVIDPTYVMVSIHGN
jgi:hypothetical protein